MIRKIKSQLRRKRLAKSNIVADSQSREITFLGDRSGIWPIVKTALPSQDEIIVYSFGIGNNISWELGLIDSFPNIQVFAFDPTPSSVQWLERQTLPNNLHFSPTGLADYCGEMSFFKPRREGRFNYSVVKRGYKYPNETINCSVKDFKTLCAENNHQHVHVLKMDIEGSEIDALPTVLESDITVDQLFVEFHYNYNDISYKATTDLIHKIKDSGYDLIWISDRNYEFGFIK